MRRWRVLPASGQLLISTDLHGNLADYRRLESLFLAALKRGVDLHWALLGDLVHGPNERAAHETPALYGYPDQSPELIDALHALRARHGRRIHVVLGNHDAGHIGFVHTAKFHDDEVEALEARLDAAQRAKLISLLQEAMVMLLAPCGLVLSHGSAGDAVVSLALLETSSFPPTDLASTRAINELLWSYGQRREVTEALLARLSAESGLSLHVVVHGHDRDVTGWFTEGGNQLQPVIFGAPDETKHFLWVHLDANYASVDHLREGHELLPLYR